MMKWIMMAIVAAVLSAPAVRANCGHCGPEGEKHEHKAEKSAKCEGKQCDSWLSGITLTDEQKAKVDEIKAGCEGGKESCKKAKDSIRAVLTAEQQKAFDANCGSGCKSKCGADKT